MQKAEHWITFGLNGSTKSPYYTNPELAKVIFSGPYSIDNFVIIFSRNDLHAINYEFDLVLTFGALNAPLKKCIYTIKLGPNTPNNIQDYLIIIEENSYFIEEMSHEFHSEYLASYLG